MRIISCIAALLLAVAGAAFAQDASTGPSTELRAGSAQAYPRRPIRFVVPLPPGIWLGVTIPANVPAPIVTTSPQALAQLIREDYARWGKIIKAAGIKAD